jgi:general secretion pathway protein K
MAVLLIFAVLTALAVRMSGNHALLVGQSRNQFEFDLALNYALGAEELARQALREDFERTGKDVDHLDETWAQALPPFEVDEGGYIEVQVEEQNGCFNLNTLADDAAGAAAHEALKRLFLGIGVPEAAADLVRDWVDRDMDPVSALSAESPDYQLVEPPYRAADQQMADLSEVWLLAGLEPEERAMLMANTCVVPGLTTFAFNANTVPLPVLAALKAGLDAADLAPLEDTVRTFANDNELLNLVPNLNGAEGNLVYESQYFRINVHAQVGQAVTILSSLAYRDPSTGIVTVLQRDFGRDFTSALVVASAQEDVE